MMLSCGRKQTGNQLSEQYQIPTDAPEIMHNEPWVFPHLCRISVSVAVLKL